MVTPSRSELGVKHREGWAQAMHGQVNGRMEESLAMLAPPVFCPSLCVLGRLNLPVDLRSFICTVRGWSEAFPVLTSQRLSTLVIKNGDKEGRKEE